MIRVAYLLICDSCGNLSHFPYHYEPHIVRVMAERDGWVVGDIAREHDAPVKCKYCVMVASGWEGFGV